MLVQGPLQAALLSRALTDWIGGDGRLVAFSVQNRAIAHPGQQLTLRRAWSPGSARDGPWSTSTSSASAATTC